MHNLFILKTIKAVETSLKSSTHVSHSSMVINMFTTPARVVKVLSPVNPVNLKDANKGKMTQVLPSTA